VLHQFGFADWILAILQSPWHSIPVNARVVGFFCCARGVRQGDPLSSLLFCLAEEVLSRALSMARNAGMIVHISYSRGVFLRGKQFLKGNQSVLIFSQSQIE
jgi:hypothetical protein